jgi:hypothetical protein
MENLEDEIQELREKTKQNRRQFLETDLQTCFVAIERADLELSLGNSLEARKELAMATRGADVIERFLRETEPPEADLDVRLADLRASLDSLRRKLDTGSAVRPE